MAKWRDVTFSYFEDGGDSNLMLYLNILEDTALFFMIADFCEDNQTQLIGNAVHELKSAYYPLYYPANLHCNWHVNTDTSHPFIIIEFIDVSMRPNVDFFTIGVGEDVTEESRVFHLTGVSAPRIATINSSSIWIQLVSLPFNYNPFHGFSFEVARRKQHMVSWNLYKIVLKCFWMW